MKPKRIETERLLLRELKTQDAEHIYKTWTSDPRVTKFMTYPTHESIDVTKGWLMWRNIMRTRTAGCLNGALS